jgi:hypothetical protein
VIILSTAPFQTFEEAVENLLELVSSLVPGKTIFLSKIKDNYLEIVQKLDNQPGVNLSEDSLHLRDTF